MKIHVSVTNISHVKPTKSKLNSQSSTRVGHSNIKLLDFSQQLFLYLSDCL